MPAKKTTKKTTQKQIPKREPKIEYVKEEAEEEEDEPQTIYVEKKMGPLEKRKVSKKQANQQGKDSYLKWFGTCKKTPESCAKELASLECETEVNGKKLRSICKGAVRNSSTRDLSKKSKKEREEEAEEETEYVDPFEGFRKKRK